jgi:hypothetical protein
MEMMTFNPYDAQVNPYGLADWYRFQNLGYQLPIVGGSDKMSAASLLGGIRTYAHLGEREFTYDHWMDAIRGGTTFVTVGPLIEFSVNGRPAGSQIDLPAGGGTLDIEWSVASVNVLVDQVEIIVGGLPIEQVQLDCQLSSHDSASLFVDTSTWIALRVRGSYSGRRGDIAAHSSAVQVLVGGQPIFVDADGLAVLEQIEGSLTYVDTLAPRPEVERFKRLRATLESAHNRLHQQLHRHGVYHRHSALSGQDELGEA